MGDTPAVTGGMISSEPLIDRLHRHGPEIALVVPLALVLLVSLLPTESGSVAQWRAGPPGWERFWYARASTIDAVANLALYMPLGFVGYLVGRKWQCPGWAAWFGAVVACASLSLFVEGVQAWMPSRVTSALDWICNTLGGAVGALLAAGLRRSLSTQAVALREEMRLRPWSAAASVIACLLVVIHLRPYDVVLSPATVAASLRDGAIDPLGEWRTLSLSSRHVRRAGRPLRPDEAVRARCDWALARVGDTAGYALLAALTAMSLRRDHRRGRAVAWGAALSSSVILAGAVTVTRVLMPSRGLDMGHLLAGLVGGIAGGGVAVLRARDHGRIAERSAVLRSLFWGATAVTLAAIVVRGCAPFVFDFSPASVSASWQRANWRPFVASLSSRPNEAFLDLTTRQLQYVVLGLLAGGLVGRGRMWRRRVCAVTIGAVALALSLELSHLVIVGRRLDITAVLLAGLGTPAAMIAMRWSRDYRRSLHVRHVDDLLTTQLIEGATYRKPAASRAAQGVDVARRMR